MFVKHTVLLLVIAAAVLAVSGDLNSGATSNSSRCDANEIAKINETKTNMKVCFNSLILHENKTCSKMEDWINYKQPIINALKCIQKNEAELEKSFNIITALVNFTFVESKSPNFTNFLKTTKTCFNDTKLQIQNCTMNVLGLQNLTYSSQDFPTLMRSLTDTNVNSACDDAQQLKKCVLERFGNSSNCTPETQNFTKTLFNIARNMYNCKGNHTNSDTTPAKQSTTSVVFIVLGLVLVMIIIIAIVCYKGKCRRN